MNLSAALPGDDMDDSRPLSPILPLSIGRGIRIGPVVLQSVQRVPLEEPLAAVAEAISIGECFAHQEKKSGLDQSEMLQIFELLPAAGDVAVILMPRHALFVFNDGGKCFLYTERGQGAGCGNFVHETSRKLARRALFAGGDFRDSSRFHSKASPASQLGVQCEQWCNSMQDGNHVEHGFCCSNMRHLFVDSAPDEPLTLTAVVELFVTMRTSQNALSNLRVTPSDINQALVRFQLWSMGGEFVRWHGNSRLAWGGSVDMGVLRPLRIWASSYVLAAMDRMCIALEQAAGGATGGVQRVLLRASAIIAQRATQVRERIVIK
jgi:hypothetical protein